MAGRGKEEEGYSVEAQENMGVAIDQFKESLIPIGSEEANKNIFATIKIMVKGVRRRLVDLGNVDAPEGPLKIQLMIFNKEHIPLIIEQLKEEGFGILTEIDVSETLKNKLDVNFKKYKILGACNPPYAHKALQAEDKIGTMLPCNVIVQEIEAGVFEVAAVNPMASMQAVENEDLEKIADEISAMLENVIEKL